MPGDPDELRDMFKAFPVPQRAYLEHVSKCTKWRIAIAAEIPKWIGKSSRVILSAMPTTSAGMLLIKPKFTILSIVAEELRRLIHGLRCMLSALRQCYTHKLRYLFKRPTFSYLATGLDSMYSPFQ